MGRRQDERPDGGLPIWLDVSGQSTLEYALVLIAFLATLLGMGAVWHASGDGRLLERAREAGSHSSPHGVDVKLLQDVTAF